MTSQIVTRYMVFILVERKPKTNVWTVTNKASGVILGHIRWYPHWRQYCFMPEDGMVFNGGCLETLREFVEKQAHDGREAR